MKTSGLTWLQAKNLLACGLAEYIEFDGKKFLNVYFVHEGEVVGQFMDDPCYYEKYDLDLLEYKFKVVSVPSHMTFKNLERIL